MDRISFNAKVAAIDWTKYQTAYGVADKVPLQLNNLASDSHDETMKASHELWCGLCHQHAYVSSAALPALAFIMEVLESANDELAIEILDILSGLAICTSNEAAIQHEDWKKHLRKKLKAELPRFDNLASYHNEELSEFAKRIVSELNVLT